MNAPSNTETLEFRFAAYIQELRDFFKQRGLSYGQPENVVALAEGVSTPGSMQDEMSSMVRSIVFRERKAIPRTELLELIVVAVGGSHVDDSAQEIHEPVRALHAFVVGVMRSMRRSAIVDEAPGEPAAPSPEFDPHEVSSFVEPAPVFFEPEAPNEPWSGARQEEPGGVREPEVRVEPPTPAWSDPVPPSAAAMPQVQVAGLMPLAQPPEASRRMSPLWPALGVVAVVLAGWLIWNASHPRPVQRVETPAAAVASAGPGAAVVPPVTSAGSVAAPGTGAARQSDLPGESRNDANAPGSAAGTAHGATVPSTSGLPPTTASGSGAESLKPETPAAPNTPTEAQGNVRTAAPTRTGRRVAAVAASIGKPGYFLVSSGVMGDHLLSASAPHYPKMAAMAGVEGQVVLQAVVSRNGNVVSAHALDGHHLLRGAATNAVRRWRFRPYLVHGRPTDISTVIILDVRGHH